jgi:hypothetical protein
MPATANPAIAAANRFVAMTPDEERAAQRTDAEATAPTVNRL